MLFELRTATPEVSSDWVEPRDLFLEGKVRDAWRLAMEKRGKAKLATANDFILNVEIARACYTNKTYMALVRMAFAAFPEDPIVRLYYSRVLLTRSRQTEGIEFLLECQGTLGETHRGWWGAELANTYASAGFEASCLRWLEAVREEEGFDSPLGLYSQSCAHEGLQQWDLAIELAERCVAAAPNWSRARGYLANCLLARGRIDAAQEQLAEAQRRGHEEAVVDFASGMLAMSLGQFEVARERLETILSNWPQNDMQDWVRRTLCVLLVELGEYDKARETAQGREEKLALPTIPQRPEGKHCFIPLPLVAQNRNQCVPTSVAMSAYPQGRSFDPDLLFQEMHGREGTPLWRTREWAERNELRVIPIRLEREAIVALLDANVPLIGVLEGPFNSHVEVICGYNDDLETLYVRDPGHWAPACWPWELATGRYNLHGGLLAVIEAERQEVLALAESWRSDVCTSLLDLAQAIAEGETEAAEKACAEIPDDQPAAIIRDSYAANVAISPLVFRERMQAVAEDESASLVARFRAVMVLGPAEVEETLAKVLEKDDSDQIQGGARRYLQLLKLMAAGDWPAAGKEVDRLLVRGCSISHFWELKSDILAELGDHQGSCKALDNAIELEPLRISAREKRLQRSANQMTMTEFTAEFESLLAQDPDDKRLLISRAELLYDGPDGREYESAAREAIRWYPRLPNCYTTLLTWYRLQTRMDLHDNLLAEARRMLPDIFVEDDEEGVEQNEPAKEESVDADAPLPEEKDELMDLVWSPGDPRRPQALARILEMNDAGQLHWYEVARLTGCRLLLPDREGETPDPSKVLPRKPPGAAHWFANALCDMLTDIGAPIPTAMAVDAWLLEVVPNFEDYVEVWFNRVLILEEAKQVEKALDQLRRLLQRYPAYSSALYRMGVVKLQQQDYPAARDFFSRALEVNPGLMGAMEMLREVHDTLGDSESALRCLRLLRKKFPFLVAYLKDEVLMVAELQSNQAAQQLLENAATDFPERRMQALRVRVLLADEQVDEAGAIGDALQLSAEEQDEEFFEECLQAKLQLASARGDEREVLALCDLGLARWPDSNPLKELKARRLLETEPQVGRQLLREILIEGEPEERTAWNYLGAADVPPDESAKELILAAPEDRREELAELFSKVIGYGELLRWNESFLTWARQQFPESDQICWRLVIHYNLNGQVQSALRMAEELHKRNPDNPEAARMLGRCLMEVDAKQAHAVLKQVCEQNRSADYLFDLARCEHIVGNVPEAMRLHWEILEQNPYLAASWTNLYMTGAPKEKLWPLLQPMLDRGYGVEEEYFFVAAVKIALDLGRRLPPSWFPLAVERWEVLQTHPGFEDERPTLKAALLAWKARRPQDVVPEMELPSGWFESLKGRFWWPKTAWIAE